jgi:hypothetical protein
MVCLTHFTKHEQRGREKMREKEEKVIKKFFSFLIQFTSKLGFFQIIKGLLPKKVLERMKFLNSKNVQQYINVDNMPTDGWKGNDDFELVFVSEDSLKSYEKELNEINNNNNNDKFQENLNLRGRKVSERKSAQSFTNNFFHAVRLLSVL